MPTINHARPLDFEVEGRVQAVHYGHRYFAVGLPDGREALLWGDRADVVASGALVVWQETEAVGRWEDEGYHREPTDPMPTMILAAGAWTHCYAASVLDDSPVAVDHLAAPNR